MARIYRRTDRIAVKVDDLIIKFTPLSVDQKNEIQLCFLNLRLKGDLKEGTKAVVLSLKYALKSIDGLIDSNDEPYKLQFENDVISDECFNDLMNLELASKLSLVCSQLANSIPKEFCDNDGKKLEGVEFVQSTNVDDTLKKSP